MTPAATQSLMRCRSPAASSIIAAAAAVTLSGGVRVRPGIVEGVVEAVAQEVASFGIEFTLWEPSAANINFATSSLDAAGPMAACADTPVGYARTTVAGEAAKWAFDDPHWMVRAIIA